MSKTKYIVFFFLLFFTSVVFATDTYAETISLPVMEDVLEAVFTGVWKPSLFDLRAFRDAVPLDEIYKNDTIVINDGDISITLIGHYFDGLPYKYRNSTILTAINFGRPNVIYVNFSLLDLELMLYTIYFEDERHGEVRCEMLCIRQDE